MNIRAKTAAYHTGADSARGIPIRLLGGAPVSGSRARAKRTALPGRDTI